jgi:hypothetical protein
VVCPAVLFALSVNRVCKTKPFGIYCCLFRILLTGGARGASVLVKSGILLIVFSIESPHKPLLPAQPRWRQVSHMITSISKTFIITRKTVSRFGVPSSQSGEGTPHNLFHPNVPLQTREHALAGISGMLRSSAGAQGAFTSRGAKPKGAVLVSTKNEESPNNAEHRTT